MQAMSVCAERCFVYSCKMARTKAQERGEHGAVSAKSVNLPGSKRTSIRPGWRRRFSGLDRVSSIALVPGLLVVACALMSSASQVRGNEAARADQPDLEAQFAELKARTAELVASARTHLDVLSPQQRLAAPPIIWSVPSALTQFKDCADCPQMVVIPAGEFTMGSPPSEQAAEAQHRVMIASPFAVSKFEITFSEWDACATDGGCGDYWPDDEGWPRSRSDRSPGSGRSPLAPPATQAQVWRWNPTTRLGGS